MQTDNQNKKGAPSERSKTLNKKGEVYYKRTKANDEVIADGMEIIKSMSDEELKNLGSKTDTLHFIHLLGLASKKTTRKISSSYGIEIRDCSTPVGVSLKTDIEIEVPYLKDVTKNKDTGIDPSEDIEYKIVKPGEDFDLTLYEFMYLIIRHEYGGYLRVDGEDFYAHLSLKVAAYKRGDSKLPTPTINFEKGMGSIRTGMVDIDEYIDGKWRIKPQYERFAPLVRNRGRRKRT